MEEKVVEIGRPIRAGQVTLLPIVESSLNNWHGRGRVSCFGIKRPVSIVVVSPSWKKAFRISGEEVPLDKIIEETPGLREALETI